MSTRRLALACVTTAVLLFAGGGLLVRALPLTAGTQDRPSVLGGASDSGQSLMAPQQAVVRPLPPPSHRPPPSRGEATAAVAPAPPRPAMPPDPELEAKLLFEKQAHPTGPEITYDEFIRLGPQDGATRSRS
ncbi:MAG: hypothetical protein EHM13_07140 [Acidobacteria bacterium]|nr:MAG: hypothetical protein EHM13_07140 [Acidobacteriota bacterium]